MNATLRAGAGLLLLAALGANAQVYRCGSSNVYTDTACRSRHAVDVRPNLVDPGPATATAEPDGPATAPLILRNISRVVTTAPSPPTTVWQRKDSEDAATASRTTGMFSR